MASEEVQEASIPPLSVDSEVYQHSTFKGMPYRILLPRNFDPAKSYPLHVFLHGIGERGTDNEKQLSVGGKRFQADSVRDKYPAFIVFPQCPTSAYWFSHEVMETLGAMINNMVTEFKVDPDRISIGGFSMGAYGTFAMVARYPGLFEAAVAISGDGDAGKADDMAKPRWQLFAGKKDDIVASDKTEKMAKALAEAGAVVSFKLYPQADHGGTWLNAFSEADFFSSLFSRKAEK